VARLTSREGGAPPALAGGTSRLLEDVTRSAGQAGVPEAAAIRSASAVPARVIGTGGTRGTIAPGMAADLVVTGTGGPGLTPGGPARVMRNGRWLS